MKINQVEELAGITKKNIRFYEDEGLIKPVRNSENGYREYSLEDVDRLLKIRLLRQLSVPIEEIRRLLNNEISFDECMERQLVLYNHQKHSLDVMKDLCMRMSEEVDALSGLDASKYLDEMKMLEEGGTNFMDVKKEDVRKKKVGPIISAIVVAAWMVLMAGIILWANSQEQIPFPILAGFLVLPTIVVICIFVALKQRMNEINGGEEDEASKY